VGQFGEGDVMQSELVIQRLLAESGGDLVGQGPSRPLTD
jgi:hypothetical protein